MKMAEKCKITISTTKKVKPALPPLLVFFSVSRVKTARLRYLPISPAPHLTPRAPRWRGCASRDVHDLLTALAPSGLPSQPLRLTLP